MLMVILTKEIGEMIKLTALESINIWTEADTLATGLKTSNMAVAMKYGLMAPTSKVITAMAKSKVKGSSPGLMGVPLKETFLKTIFMGEVSIVGLMGAALMVLG